MKGEEQGNYIQSETQENDGDLTKKKDVSENASLHLQKKVALIIGCLLGVVILGIWITTSGSSWSMNGMMEYLGVDFINSANTPDEDGEVTECQVTGSQNEKVDSEGDPFGIGNNSSNLSESGAEGKGQNRSASGNGGANTGKQNVSGSDNNDKNQKHNSAPDEVGGSNSNNIPSSGGSSSGNTKPMENPTSSAGTTSHTHHFTTVYRTIYHDALTHTEQVQVGSDPIYETRSYIVCRGCDMRNPSADHLNAHMDNGENATTYTAYENIQVGSEPIYETRVVVDREAYQEQVPDHQECSCGARK